MADYIEREAAIEAVKKERDYTGKYSFEEEHAWAVGFQQGITFAISDVATIPAADVRPVVRGRWVADKEDMEWGCYVVRYHCSNCGRLSHYDGKSGKFMLSDFCPNCGADMRTGAE